MCVSPAGSYRRDNAYNFVVKIFVENQEKSVPCNRNNCSADITEYKSLEEFNPPTLN